MAEQTTNLNLKKPAYADSADIKDINDNMDILDSHIGSLETKTPSGDGTLDQVLRSNGDGTTRWDDAATEEEISTAVGDWLAENVTQSNDYIEVNQSLTVPNAAADAKVTGDKIAELKSGVINCENEINGNLLIPVSGSSIIQGTYKNSDGSVIESTTNIRTSGVMRVYKGQKICFKAGTNTRQIYYGYRAVGGTSFTTGSWQDDGAILRIPSDWEIILVFRKGVSDNITPSDYDAVTEILPNMDRKIKEVESLELSSFCQSNLFENAERKSGFYESNGTFTSNSGFVSYLAKVNPNQTYILTGSFTYNQYSYICAFDKNKGFIKNHGRSQNGTSITTTGDTYYLGIGMKNPVSNEKLAVSVPMNEIIRANNNSTRNNSGLCISDTFNRDDSEDLGTVDYSLAEISSSASVAVSNYQSWDYVNSNKFVVSEKTAVPSIVAQDSKAIAYVKAGVPSGCVSVIADIGENDKLAIVFNLKDENNFSFAEFSRTSIQIGYYENGTRNNKRDLTTTLQGKRIFSVWFCEGRAVAYSNFVPILDSSVKLSGETGVGFGYLPATYYTDTEISGFAVYTSDRYFKQICEDFKGGGLNWGVFAEQTCGNDYSLTYPYEVDPNDPENESKWTYSARFEVKYYGETAVAGGRRSEISSSSLEFGKEYIYDFYVMLPSDTEIDVKGMLICQWHSAKDNFDEHTSPPLALEIIGDSWNIPLAHFTGKRMQTQEEPYWFESLYKESYVNDLGKWVHFVFKVRWGRSQLEQPYIEVYKDGKLVVSYYDVNASNDIRAPYFKFGIYKYSWNGHPKDPEGEGYPPVVQDRVVYFKKVCISEKN